MESSGTFTLFQIIERGGWAMVPLVISSVLALAVVIERMVWGLRRSRIIPSNFAARCDELLRSGHLDELKELCLSDSSPLSRILLAGLRNYDRSREELVEALELAGRREHAGLQKHIGILGTIAAIAPLLGLLGTVIGIIRTFTVIEQHGIGNPQLLAGGISEALIATASGICIAVPAVIFYRYFSHRARALTLELEGIASELLSRISRVSGGQKLSYLAASKGN